MMLRAATLRHLDFSDGSPKTKQYWNRVNLVLCDLYTLNNATITALDVLYYNSTMKTSELSKVYKKLRNKLAKSLRCKIAKDATVDERTAMMDKLKKIAVMVDK